MKITRLRNKLMIGALAISVMLALASMLAVSWVIRQQHLDQSNALLAKASRVIDDSLAERKANLLAAAHQLATQKNLGSTIWYLAQYAQAGVDHETLFNTYQQLVKDTYQLGRVAKLSRIAIYDSAGNLVSFASFDSGSERVGFVERFPEPLFQLAELKDGEELNRQNLRTTNPHSESKSNSNSVARPDIQFAGRLPQRESVHYALSDGSPVIESHAPIMGQAFDPATGKQEIRQLGLVVTQQALDQAFVEQLSRMTDIRINIFRPQGFSSGELAAYRSPDWSGGPAMPDERARAITFNEITIDGAGFYQCLIPLYADKRLVGTIAALHSKEIVRKNTVEMMQTLGLIAVACLLLIFPFAWYFAISISRPLTILSAIFRGVASGEQDATLSDEFKRLKKARQRGDELGDLTQSFAAMDDAVKQKIQQINEINASLEDEIEQRTRELRAANEELTKLATHDALTGLPNRKLLGDRLQQALFAARRNDAQLALMYLDLDEFKPINDTLGHDFGDLLLVEVTKRTQHCVRDSDTLARIGGDEFVVLLPAIESEQDARAVAEKIRCALNQPFELAGKSLKISSSIGIAIYPEHGGDENTLLKNADAAMYCAKNGGRNTVRLFSTGPGQCDSAGTTPPISCTPRREPTS